MIEYVVNMIIDRNLPIITEDIISYLEKNHVLYRKEAVRRLRKKSFGRDYSWYAFSLFSKIKWLNNEDRMHLFNIVLKNKSKYINKPIGFLEFLVLHTTSMHFVRFDIKIFCYLNNLNYSSYKYYLKKIEKSCKYKKS